VSMFVFWVVTPCGRVGRYRRFGGTYCLKMETVCSSQTLVSTFKSTRRHNPEDKHFKGCENLKSQCINYGNTMIDIVHCLRYI
jgi:hypothetical protein